MRNPLIPFTAGLASVVALTAATSALAQLRLISEGPQIELRDLAARVVVTPEARDDIDIKVHYGKAKVPVLMVSQRGDVTVLNGHLSDSRSHPAPLRLRVSDEDLSKGVVFITGLGKVRVEDLPLVFVRVPNNAVVKDSAYSIGHIKASRSLDIIMNGAGRWSVEPVAGPLNIINSGSGDIQLTTAGDTIIDNLGPGEISVASVQRLKLTLTGPGGFSAGSAQDTEITNQGPGDVDIGSVRSVKVKINGPGDLTLGQVMNGMTLVNNGPADVSVGRISGAVSLNLAGSGDVDIADGHIPGFALRGSGSGDIVFGGTAGTVNIDFNGPGDIHIMRATGQVTTKVRGSGDMNIGH